MAIDPNLIVIKPVSELPSKPTPEATDQFLIVDGTDVKKSEWGNVMSSIVSGTKGILKPTDPTPTIDGLYKPSEVGVYANAGGLEALAGYDTVFQLFEGVWSKAEMELPTVTLEQTTGFSEVNAMSQKAVTNIVGGILLSSDEFVNGGFINYSNGAFSSHLSYLSTGKKWLDEGTQLTVKSNSSASTAAISVYDSSNNYIQAESLAGKDSLTTFNITIGTGGRFVDFTTLVADKSESKVSILSNFVNSEELTSLANNVKVNSNDVFVLENPSTNQSSLDAPLDNHVFTRREVYSCIRDAKFTNCDPAEKRTLFLLWNGHTGNFHLRTSVWNGTAWVQEFAFASPIDTVNPTGTGVFDIKIVSGLKTAEFRIDTNPIAIYIGATGAQLNPLNSTPEFIFSQSCYNTGGSSGGDTFVPKTIKLYPNTKLPVVSFQFDDIHSNDAQVVDLFDTYGLTCGFAFVASSANITNKAAEYLEYQKKGYQILNHSTNGTIFNTTNYTYATAQAVIMEARRNLEKAGFVVNGWVSPSSSLATAFIPIIKQAHAYAATYTDAGANGRTSNPCNLTRYSLESNTITAIKAKIDDDIANDKILTFYGHPASFGVTNPTSGEVWDLVKLQAVIDYCIQKRDEGLLYVGGSDDSAQYYFDL